MKNILICLMLMMSTIALAQSKKKQDQQAIKEMCGCYEITFNFAETFDYQRDYQFHDNYRTKGFEWVQLIKDDKDEISMQHLLIVGGGQIVKHWRQDWLYENTELYSYVKDNGWKLHTLPKSAVKGQWSQKVYHVDDSPRYESSASWVHVDGKHYWEGVSDSPLPRREYSKRSDYNVMLRTNRHELTDFGWIHEQDNGKVNRTEKGDELLAEEKGMNVYTKVEDSKCVAAQEWWKKNEQYWADVRSVWAEVYAANPDFSYAQSLDDKMLYEVLFALGDEMAAAEKYNSTEVQAKVSEIIKSYMD
ncbi:DUF6607 family protein [Roseivirga seohaensis]|uniref:DUF6607 family protein n=1 Tax=Roseivirga seohaensis TaxID=1914963 RepID=UPI003BAA6BD5